MARVRVGSGLQAKDYAIPAALLRKRSKFFDNALKSCWAEGEHRIVDLANDDSGIFSLYLHTLYGEALPLESVHITDTTAHERILDDQLTLSRLYVFAEFLQHSCSKNTILDSLYDTIWPESRRTMAPGMTMGSIPFYKVVTVIWEGMKEGSLARQFLVDAYLSSEDAFHFSRRSSGSHVEDYPNEFLDILIKSLYKGNLNIMPMAKRGDYHEKV